MDSVRLIFAKRLREIRRLRGMSVEQLGSRLGKSGTTVRGWENGRGQPDLDTVVHLAGILDVNVLDLIDPAWNEELVFTSDELSLINTYRKLNDDGKAQARTQVEVLVKSGVYSPKDFFGAVPGTGASVSEESA